MTKQKRAKNSLGKKQKYLFTGFFMGGIFFLVLSIGLAARNKKNSIEAEITSTLSLVKSTCQKYADYKMGITTKDLQTMINKVNVLKDYTGSEKRQELLELAQDQYLSGVILLDKELQVSENVKLDRKDNDAILNLILEDTQAEEILNFSKKIFADRVEINGKIYEYAISAREDEAGIIIIYCDTTEFRDDKYEISLSNFLNNLVQSKNEVLVVTDGEKVISSSSKQLNGLLISECPVSNVLKSDKQSENINLIELKDEGKIWLGKKDSYRNYYLYVFYRIQKVYPEYFWHAGIIVGMYLIFCLLILIFLQKQKEEKMNQMKKELQLLQSVSSIYDVNLILYPQKNTWIPILETKRLEKTIKGIKDADEMLQQVGKLLMMESAREEFWRLTDLKSLSGRMKKRNFLGYTFEAVTGKWYQTLLISKKRNDENEVTEVMLLMRNVSEQKQKEMDYQEKLRIAAEKAATADASKTDFLCRMSHDIRTPINGIRGMTEIGLENLEDTSRIKDCFVKIRTASDFLLELVNNVLDMSKIEAGETKGKNEPFDLREILKNAATIVSLQAEAAAIDFRQKPVEIEHSHLLGSPLNIQRVFQNLMSNAVKYNRQGGLVEVSCQELESDGENVRILFICRDTGIGMSKEFQKHAFEIFTQEHKTARTTYSGSGVGLSVVKKTVELLGGKVDFVSEEGKGTVFTVELTLKIDKTYEDEKKEVQKREEEISISGLNILVAEDNELNLEIETYMLEEQGVLVTPAKDGTEAVELFAKSEIGEFDLILMDIMMPRMNGYEAAEAIRKMDRKDAGEIPIFAVSANAFSDDIAASKKSGMNEHLSKPIDFDEMMKRIGEYRKKVERNRS